jgi:23S rRNA pseudouridine1911/1915/1917 synthase
MKLDLLYEDKALLVLNKPPALVVMPGVNTGITLLNLLTRDYPDAGFTDLGLVHRLDRDTTGLMLVAKNQDVKHALQLQFQQRTIEKKYYAMVKGNMPRDDYVITHAIGRHKKQPMKKTISENGKSAHTQVYVLKRYNTKTLVNVQIKTGRTHQIRVHLSSIGYPILGDALYSPHASKKTLQLQSYFLGFSHPISYKYMTFELPLLMQ